jgi:hypothetical protein
MEKVIAMKLSILIIILIGFSLSSQAQDIALPKASQKLQKTIIKTVRQQSKKKSRFQIRGKVGSSEGSFFSVSEK